MKIAYSREAMHALLALRAPQRAKAINMAQKLAASDGSMGVPSAMSGLLPLAEGSEFRLGPFSTTGDLVVAQQDDKLIVVALSDVIESLKQAAEQ